MPSRSAGIMLYRQRSETLEVLLVHPGGPFWARKDLGAWSIPKGEYAEGEDPSAAARREFEEELGHALPPGDLLPLGEVVQSGGKRVQGWALAGDFEVTALRSNLFELEWPPHSGKRMQFPEVDRAAWLDPALAAEKIIPAQKAFLDRLVALLAGRRPASPSL
ncbi:NTP pyrophosphohydrolase [Labrys miyagiensis]|uniref:NTP pyrophosphohydrolase n=1 Tax=Labrys miyagiensis TaxID=346912 RepID=A0ABQ6CF65_9HYPH|nr:NUDIX domain-containing protein [Labrys miyagiensis]GLS18913.1 NTP pyrophosphohydrolase [Labrys miyagiensis]